jgi:hypothetical protein
MFGSGGISFCFQHNHMSLESNKMSPKSLLASSDKTKFFYED